MTGLEALSIRGKPPASLSVVSGVSKSFLPLSLLGTVMNHSKMGRMTRNEACIPDLADAASNAFLQRIELDGHLRRGPVFAPPMNATGCE
jgi:hypothetical protein